MTLENCEPRSSHGLDFDHIFWDVPDARRVVHKAGAPASGSLPAGFFHFFYETGLGYRIIMQGYSNGCNHYRE